MSAERGSICCATGLFMNVDEHVSAVSVAQSPNGVHMKAKVYGLLALACAITQMPVLAKPSQTQHPHIFNIYASVQEGHPQEVEIAQAKIVELERCGIAAISDSTVRYEGWTAGLYITLTGPHPDLITAKAELQKAKTCGIEGYTRRATFLGGE
jgi:hypothetical protein